MVKVQEDVMTAESQQQGRTAGERNGKHMPPYPMHQPAPTIRFPPGFEPPSVSPEGLHQHVVDFHVYPGVTVSLQMGDNVQVFKGPVTVPMVSTNSSPPIPMPVQVPPGHMIQQVVDESGALRHVILSANPHPILPLPSHYGPGPAGGGNPPPQQFYTPGGIPPFPAPHFGPFGPSPPPPHFHKDERSRRIHHKLKRKLEQQKQQRGEPSPPFSPRKEVVNGVKGRKGVGSTGTSEDGDDTSSAAEEDDSAAVLAFLSAVKSPTVAELKPRSALLAWSALTEGEKDPDLDVREAELLYEVLLADTAKGGKYRSIYSGCSFSCRIEDLRPGSEYSVCLKVHHLDGLQGRASEPLVFTTPACPPDAPLAPKLILRTRTSLQLRWNAPIDNGAAIVHYVLESDEGKGEGFVEVCKNRNKQHNVIRLQPATSYRFRISAVNECGRSAYSDVVTFATCGTPPAQPAAPTLLDADVTSLRLSWQKRPSDDEFTLQMDDQRSGHGFLAIYNGKDTAYVVEKLNRHSDYKFRLRAHNEEGASRWSDDVTFRTRPARPAPPPRPATKGKIHANSFKVRWDPPTDRGGADISQYLVELNSGNGFEAVYEGTDTEMICDRLLPGKLYQVRVAARGPGGLSDPSEPVSITTEPICPGPCAPPRLHGKPRPHSLALKFSYPEYDGGAEVTQLEVEMTAADAGKRVVHAGPETECTVSDLSPGQPYLFHVRALNRAGYGPWSEGVEVLSGAAPPDAPSKPQVCCRSPHHAAVSWTAPPHNGAPITEYRLEMALSGKEDMSPVYHGPASTCDVRGLHPNTTYSFRLLAFNSAGSSEPSDVAVVRTPPSAPGVVTSVRCSPASTSLALSWLAPSANGSDITHYNIDFGDKVLTATSTEHVVSGLKPETAYRIRVQAVNGVGSGPLSSQLKASTLPLPPSPPHLECATHGHNFLKLKWGDGRNPDFTNYSVEMENTRFSEFQSVYQGTGHACKVSRLQELTCYSFRVSACNDAGQGPWSEVVQFRTTMAPPPSVKGLRTAEVTQTSCTIEWSPCRHHSTDPVLYQAQLSRVKAQDFRQVYRGPEPRTVLEGLEPGATYCVRVLAVRMSESGELPGPTAAPLTFSTLPLSPTQTAPVAHPRAQQAQVIEHKQFTDQQCAIIILSIFSLFAVLVAVLMQRFIDWGAQH